MHHRTSIITAFVPVVALAIAGCADSTAPSHGTVTLSFASAARATASSSTGALAAIDLTIGSDLVISKVQLVLAETELKGAASAGCAAETNDDHGGQSRGSDDCEEAKLDPALIEVPLGAGASQSFVLNVPAGVYSALETKIEAVGGDERGASTFLTANPTFRNVSVRVEGTYKGKAFVYTGNPEGRIEAAFASPLTVADGGTVNVTLKADVSTWFVTSSGATIDPSTATPGSANGDLVASNIRRSLHAFEDDDRDGADDHHGHGGGEGSGHQ
jgi:hypothetical protein